MDEDLLSGQAQPASLRAVSHGGAARHPEPLAFAKAPRGRGPKKERPLTMFETPLIGLLALVIVVVGLVVLQRLEFLSVFSRRRKPLPDRGEPADTTPPRRPDPG